MSLKEYLLPKAIMVGLEASGKDEVLSRLSDLMKEAYPELDREHVFSILKAREDMASTAIGKGIAVPHAKTDRVGRIYGALAVSRDGIDFDAPDHKPTHVFFALISPVNQVQAHLKALSMIMQLFQHNTRLREQLTEATSPEEVWDILSSLD